MEPYCRRQSESFIWRSAHIAWLLKIAGSSNGRTAAFEAVNEGPTPSPAADFALIYRHIVFMCYA